MLLDGFGVVRIGYEESCVFSVPTVRFSKQVHLIDPGFSLQTRHLCKFNIMSGQDWLAC
jgi:hypothetical protein